MTELKIMNMWQAIFYMKNVVNPIRVELGLSDKLVFVFSKEQTFELYGEWLKQCREHKNQMRNQI